MKNCIVYNHFGYSHFRNLNVIANVDRVDYFGGATWAMAENRNNRNGVSIGNFINLNIRDEITDSFKDRVIIAVFLEEDLNIIKMKNYKLLLELKAIIVIISIMAFSCEDKLFPRISIGIINNSVHDIQYLTTIYEPEGLIYPDTILPLNISPPFRLSKAGKSSYMDFNMTGKDVFSEIPSDTLSIYIFPSDTLALSGCETIRAEYNVLVRYDLSFEDLERLNWQVYYPPNDSMEEIQMYPSE